MSKHITLEGLHYLNDICKVANALSMDGVIIEPKEKRIRGVNDDTSLILLDHFEPDGLFQNFDMICINRVSYFLNRLSLIIQNDSKLDEKITIDAIAEEISFRSGVEQVNAIISLTLKNKNIRVDFRCAHPGIIKAPKSVRDKRQSLSFDLQKDDINLIQRAAAAMGSGMNANDQTMLIRIIGGDRISLQIEDSVKDSCNIELENDSIKPLSDESLDKFERKYPLQKLITLFKLNKQDTVTVIMKPNGFMELKLHDINFFVIPKANMQ